MKRMQRVFGDLDSLRFVDGRLDDERRAAFISHLAEDAAESERVATWGRQNEVLRAVFASVALEPIPVALRLANVTAQRPAAVPPTPKTTPLRVLPAPAARSIARDLPQAAPRRAPVTRRSALSAARGPLGVAVMLALAVLAIVAFRGAGPWFSAGEDGLQHEAPAATLVSRAVDAHATYAVDSARPVELTAAQLPQLATWIRHRLGMAVAPPDFAAEGWTLLGGRLVPGLDSPAAFFVYENRGGERLSMLATAAPHDATQPMTLSTAGRDGAVMTWVVGPLAYALTAPRSLDWLSRNGEALKNSVSPSRRD